MAIVFDSDAGTISGLSVGGLPNGIVDGDMLAANAVTEAKIASSAVVTAKLNDDAVTNAKIANDAITEHELAGGAVVTAAINDDAVTGSKVAAGTVIQAKKVKYKAAANTTSTSYVEIDNSFRPTITPSLSSSTIIADFELNVCGDVDNDSQNFVVASLKIDKIQGGTTTTVHEEGGSLDAGGHTRHRNVAIGFSFSSGSTSEIEFRCYAKITSSPSNRSLLFGQANHHHVTLMEVAG